MSAGPLFPLSALHPSFVCPRLDIDAFTGTVSTFTIPEVITTIVTILDPTSTLYATCSSTPISTIPSSLTAPQTQSTTSQPSPSPTPTTIAITSTPSPTVVTAEQTTVLDNGSVTVITYTTTSTPPPTVVVVVTSSASQSQASKSSSSNIGPIIGGAAGGFVFVVGVVVALWFILCVRLTHPPTKSLT